MAGRRRSTTGSGADRVTRDEATPEAIAEALAAEQALGERAREVRSNEPLSHGLFMSLYPLLCEPIPLALITKIGATKGKPYESTGLRSVQVQHNRMNAVLTPLWWSETAVYSHEGTLCEVTVGVGLPGETPLVQRSSCGGVARGSTLGNIHKGSYTNAAKLAFARLGVGAEIYVGAADLDPDTNAEAAEEQGRTPRAARAAGPRALTEVELARIIKAVKDAEMDMPVVLAAVGAEDLQSLTTEHAFEIRKLLDEQGGKA